jgi:hypothetical protein
MTTLSWYRLAYLLFAGLLIGGFLWWGILTTDPNDRITAFFTAGSNFALVCFVMFLTTGSRR